MPVLRNKISATVTGGPRQFAEIRDTVLLRADNKGMFDEIRGDLFDMSMSLREMENAPVAIAEPQTSVEDVIREIARREDKTVIRQAAEEVAGESGVVDITRATVRATNRLLSMVSDIPGVSSSSFAFSYADYGPENLRLRPGEMATIPDEDATDQDKNLEDINEQLGVHDAWETTRGENCIIAIFDTGFSRDIISGRRVVDTFHSGGTTSVYESEEGHGTMCAGAAAANKEEGVPYDGVAPEAGVILVRITDSEGQIRSDIITEAWDYLISNDYDRPVVANHSYGTPICTGRPRTRFCNNPEQDLVKRALSDSDITGVYAAGNEAMQCGHRPSGITNAVTSTNSLAEVITVGALRFSGREAQRYSSHGRGDCAPVADPKPNVSSIIPSRAYYGAEGGYEIKDMGIGVGGSAAGTSHASPTVAGAIGLLQSAAVEERGEPLQTEELKQILHNTSEVPRRTHINMLGLVLSEKGYDARFGHGQVRPAAAMEEI